MSPLITTLFLFLTKLSISYSGGCDGLLVALGIKPSAYNLDGYNSGIYGFPVWLITVNLLN